RHGRQQVLPHRRGGHGHARILSRDMPASKNAPPVRKHVTTPLRTVRSAPGGLTTFGFVPPSPLSLSFETAVYFCRRHTASLPSASCPRRRSHCRSRRLFTSAGGTPPHFHRLRAPVAALTVVRDGCLLLPAAHRITSIGFVPPSPLSLSFETAVYFCRRHTASLRSASCPRQDSNLQPAD